MRMTLQECIEAIDAVIGQNDATYVDGEVRFHFASHAHALRSVRIARDALATMKEVEAGVPERGRS